MEQKPHSELLHRIERGIRATGETEPGEVIRYEARAALREIEEQLEAARNDNVNWRREAVDQQQRYLDTKEQLEAAQSVVRKYHEWLERHEQLNVGRGGRLGYIGLDHPAGSYPEGCEACAVLNPASRPT